MATALPARGNKGWMPRRPMDLTLSCFPTVIPAELAHPEWADLDHPGYGSWDEVFAALGLQGRTG